MATNTTLVNGYDTTEDRSYVNIILLCVLLPLTTFIFGLRIYSRAILGRNMGIDDWMCSWSMVRLASLSHPDVP